MRCRFRSASRRSGRVGWAHSTRSGLLSSAGHCVTFTSREKWRQSLRFMLLWAPSGEDTSRLVRIMSDVNTASTAGDRRWLILGVIGIAQLMVVLDATIMNIALPSAQRALHFSTVDRQWVVTAYTLAFGSLLLLGGRLADLLGRKVTFLVGLVGF